jgi:nucleotide-binding universal stress UspA family protein
MFTKMLVPLDGSEISGGILPWVSHMAKNLDIPVLLLSIIDPDNPTLPHQITTPGVVRYQGRLPFLSFAADEQHYTGVPAESARGDLPTAPSKYQYDYADNNPQNGAVGEMSDMEEWLRERASFLERQGVNVLEEKVVAAHDRPSRVILQFAEDYGCDFIAMASHDRNLLEQIFKGSVTSEVIRSSRIPVMALTPEKRAETPDQTIGLSSLSVLLDGSQFAEAVLPYVESLASRLSLEIVLIRWLTKEQLHPAFVGTGSDLLNADTLRAQIERELTEEASEAEQYLQSITDRLNEEGLNARWDIPRISGGSAKSELTERCTESMIMLASHGRTGVFRWLEGSVAEELLKGSGSGCPLMIIPPVLAQQDESQ